MSDDLYEALGLTLIGVCCFLLGLVAGRALL